MGFNFGFPKVERFVFARRGGRGAFFTLVIALLAVASQSACAFTVADGMPPTAAYFKPLRTPIPNALAAMGRPLWRLTCCVRN